MEGLTPTVFDVWAYTIAVLLGQRAAVETQTFALEKPQPN